MRVADLVAHATHKRCVHALSAKSAVAIGLATAGSQARIHTPLMQRARPGLLRAHLESQADDIPEIVFFLLLHADSYFKYLDCESVQNVPNILQGSRVVDLLLIIRIT